MLLSLLMHAIVISSCSALRHDLLGGFRRRAL